MSDKNKKSKKTKLNECNEKIKELNNILEEEKDKNLRTHADFQNIKKRMEREQARAIEKSNELFSLDMLDILDTLYLAENAIKNEKEKEGITNTIKKLESIFKKYHITEVLYDIFDPINHEAIQSVESQEEKGKIIDVHRKGYKIKDRILRPAMVTVSK